MTAIVFDLDGTLVDSAPGIAAAVNTALAAQYCRPLSLAQVTSFIGNGVPALIEQVAIASGISMLRREALLEGFRSAYYADPTYLTALFEGVLPCLEGLRASGFRLGICTNKPEEPTHQILDKLGIAGLFDAVVGGDTASTRKPDPAPLHLAFERMGRSGIYVGDSEVDAACAAQAGIPFVLFTEGYRKTPVEDLPHMAKFSRYGDLSALLSRAAA